MTVIEQPCETTVAPVTRREVLHRAADLLEEFGWCQDFYGYCKDEPIDDPGDIAKADRMCTAGALLRARLDLTGADPDDDSAAMLPLYRGVCGNVLIADWNDEPGRTRAEVVARLRQAAEAAA